MEKLIQRKNKRKIKRNSKKGSAEQENKKGRTKEVKKTDKKYSVDSLLEKAQECIDSFNYEVAQKFCQRALEIEADNLKALEVSGQLMLEMADTEGSKKCFGRAITISPETGHSKYMYLGQLLEGEEAVACFQKGIEVMLRDRDKQLEQVSGSAATSIEENDNSITCKDISCAYLNIAEMYMTDLCFSDNAEFKCKENIDKAVEIDPDNPEAYQQLASFFLTKQQLEEAREAIQKSLSFWLPKMKIIISPGEEKPDFDPTQPCLLSYQVRIATSQLLIELEDYNTAIEVLDMLLDEDDEVVQVWYLIGWVNYLKGDDYKENARDYLIKAKKVYRKVDCDDEDLLVHIEELLQELGSGSDKQSDDDNSDLDENELETSSEEDMNMDK